MSAFSMSFLAQEPASFFSGGVVQGFNLRILRVARQREPSFDSREFI